MRTQRRLEKISTAISLIGLALGFSVLGLLIVAKEHDGGTSITGGILGILLGSAFLIAACLHWKGGHQIQSEAVEDPRDRFKIAVVCDIWRDMFRCTICNYRRWEVLPSSHHFEVFAP